MNDRPQKNFSFKSRKASFTYAFNGLIHFFKTEPNAILHLIAALAAILLSFYFGISKIEWLVVILCIILVFAAELFNTSLERLCDKVHPQFDPFIKQCKDLSAAAVWVASLGSLIAGLIIFLPYIL